MIKVILHGKLGRRFGREWNLRCKSVEEVIRALNANTKNSFSKYIIDVQNTSNIGYACIIDGKKVEEEILLKGPCSKNSKIEFIPLPLGSNPVQIVIQIVVAVVLSAISALLAPSPQVNSGQNDSQRDSYLFTGGPQPARQGRPVPLGYGIMKIFPIPISVDFEYKNIRTNSPTATSPNTSTTSRLTRQFYKDAAD